MNNKRKLFISGAIFLLFLNITMVNVYGDSNTIAVLERKIKILDKIQSQESYTQMLIGKLESDWPKLFTAKTSDDLFNKYSFITWYIDEESKKDLKKDINKHLYYIEYKKLLQDNLLPAKKVTTIDLKIDAYAGDTIAVTATYDVLLKNGVNRTLEVTLKAKNESLDFSPSFNTRERTLIPIETEEEYLELIYKSKMLHSIHAIRKLSKDQFNFLFDLKPDAY